MDSFQGVHLATIERAGKVIQTTLKGLTELRQQVFTLLKVPIDIYTSLRDGWWRFALEGLDHKSGQNHAVWSDILHVTKAKTIT